MGVWLFKYIKTLEVHVTLPPGPQYTHIGTRLEVLPIYKLSKACHSYVLPIQSNVVTQQLIVQMAINTSKDESFLYVVQHRGVSSLSMTARLILVTKLTRAKDHQEYRTII